MGADSLLIENVLFLVLYTINFSISSFLMRKGTLSKIIQNFYKSKNNIVSNCAQNCFSIEMFYAFKLKILIKINGPNCLYYCLNDITFKKVVNERVLDMD